MVAEKHIQAGKRFRLGGLVQPGSLVRGDNLAVTFQVADGSAALPVAYKEFFRICSVRGRVWSPKAHSTPPACSRRHRARQA